MTKLPNFIRNIEVPFPPFNHRDFMYAKGVNTLLYDDAIGMMLRNY